ncbi:tripartite tricarboxylate transporter TctB family protein [Tianweitania sp. Rool2]|uniref:Tripartite tricarboxylate transporter TctB family protein n=2 Tax=Oryzicola mucosus TaxID=2767425 RepID=A0A8J6PIJ2_9HYPH|nr:tripartite tricarboxylate transporter TctB family protein [Oryzicola mucosus]
MMSLEYEAGTSARMGPGYFPRILSVGLGVLGLVIMAGAVKRTAPVERLEPWTLAPLLWIAGSVAVFAFLLPRLGLVISLAVLLIGSSLASHEFTWRGTIVSTVVLIVTALGAFVYGIGLQFPVWPTIF